MKEFHYNWDDSCFILHMQVNKTNSNECKITITRSYVDRDSLSESESMKSTTRSHRFIVSRSHPNEEGFVIQYPDDVTVEAFKIDDRAYYPTKSFFVG